MIRSNLSTRPFYNEGAVRFWFLLIALIIVMATFFNGERFLRYSRSDTDLAAKASQDERRARELGAESTKLRSSVDVTQINITAAEAGIANGLIDRRAFSWTALFNQLEETLPSEVRITSLRQGFDRERGTVLTMTIVAGGVEAIDDFMERLRATTAFGDVLITEDRVDPDSGQLDAVLQAVYRPGLAATKVSGKGGR